MANTVVVNIIADVKNMIAGVHQVSAQLNQMDRNMKAVTGAMVGAGAAAGIMGGAAVAAGAIGAAALGGMALAGVGAGIAIAAQSEAVKTAWSSAGDHMIAKLQSMADPIENVLVAGADKARVAFDTISPSIGRIFAATAPVVDQFMNQLNPIAQQLGPILEQSFNAGIPVMQAFLGGLQPVIAGFGGFMNEIGKASPHFAAMVSSFMGGIGQLLPAFGRLLAALAPIATQIISALLPAVTSLVNWITNNLVPIIASLTTHIINNAQTYAIAAGAIIGIVGVIKTFITVANAVKAVINAWKIAQIAFNVVMMLNPFTLILIGIGLLIAALVLAWKNSETFRNIVTGVWNAVKSAVSSVLNWFTGTLWPGIQRVYESIKNGVQNVKDKWNAAWSAITSFVSSIPSRIMGFFSSIAGWFSNQWNSIKTSATNAFNAVTSFVSSIPSRIIGFFAGLAGRFMSIWNNVKSGATNAFNAVVSFIGSIPGRILGALGNLGGLLLGAGRKVIDGFLSGITGAFGKVRSTLSNLTSMLPDWKGPAKRDATLLYDAGQLVIEGFTRGLESQYGTVHRSLNGFTDRLQTGFNAPQLSVAAASYRNGSARTEPVQLVFNGPIVGGEEEIGRYMVRGIQAYESQNGSGWRNR